MHFINVLDGSANGMKLVTNCFEGMSILSNRFGATFHQLQVILESQFTSLRMMAERSFQCKSNITCSRETNDDNNGFLSERGELETEKSLIGCSPRQIFGVEC